MSGETSGIRWYHRPVTIVVAILIIGPFALPLVWGSSSLKRWHKWAATVLLIGLTIWLIKSGAELYSILLRELEALSELR